MLKRTISKLVTLMLFVSLCVSFLKVQIAMSESGLVAYWKFDEGSGTTAYDSSGNGNTGTLVNGPSWVNGKYGKALSFDGENDYVDCGTLGDFGSTALEGATTYVCWLKSSQTALSFILGTENDYPSTCIVIHTNTPEVDKVRVYLRDDNWNRLAADLVEPFDFTGTGWHHFAFVVDAEHAELTFYIDGIPRAIAYYYQQSPFDFSDFQYPLFIGAHNMYGSIVYGPPMQPLPKVTFEGVIDEVRIYSRALTEEEIKEIYTGSSIPVGGMWTPINKAELLAPWMGIASIIMVATASFVYVKRKKARINRI